MKIQFSVIFYLEETVIGDFVGLEAVQILQYKLILQSALTSGSVSRSIRKERKKEKFLRLFTERIRCSAIFTGS
jgi:hypothetical protein